MLNKESNNDHHSAGVLFQQEHHHHQMQQNQIHHQQQQQHHHKQVSFGMMQSSPSSSAVPGSFNISKDAGSVYDLGELDQAFFLYLDAQTQPAQEQRQNSGVRPHTLNIFPSHPMHVEPTASASEAITGLVSPDITVSKRSSEPSVDPSNPRNDVASAPQPAKVVKREGNHKGPNSSSEQGGPKSTDPKTLRRLAQNREAARKSRLRKKAYVQQLESSRMRLAQLEQEIQRARSQGLFQGGTALLPGDQGLPVAMGGINSEAALFNMEYGRWLEEHNQLIAELRKAVEEHLPENELRAFVDKCLAHYDQVISLKDAVAKSDIFHIFSGVWKSPAERCFMWMGGFRPSELVKIMLGQIEPLTEQQLVGICGLQQSTQEAEEALSQGMEALNQSLTETIIFDSLCIPPDKNYMSQMSVAINKLSTLEGFLRQADNLRQQTLHRLHQILTTRQAARWFLAIAEYFHRLRVLSSLWVARPRLE